MKKKTTIITKIRKQQDTEGRCSLEPEKALPSGEFIIVAKFSGHVLCHLASSRLNVVY